jgi:hypothetical protein
MLDHVTLVLDEGIAFIRDFPPEYAAEEGSEICNDWKNASMKVKRPSGSWKLPSSL